MLRKRSFVALAVAAIALAVLPRTAHAQKPTPATKKPVNVLFIAVDDMNTHLSVYGNNIVKSPNLERLAKRGVVFKQAYCQLPWCNPSRVSLLSGRRPDTTRVLDLVTLPRTYLPNVVFLPELFKKNGYFTARVGKIYHEARQMKGTDNDPLSFDVSENGFGKPQPKIAREGLITGRGTRSGEGNFPGFHWAALDVADAETSDGIVARRSAALIEQAVKDGKPFWIGAGFRKPHLMWEAPKKYFDLYKPEDITLPREPEGHLAGVPASARGPQGPKPPPTEAERKQAVLSYYACISFTDAQIGVLLDTMDKNKLWDNTVVVLFGDHGYNLGEHGGQWEKTKLWEESIHAPLIIAAPGVTGGVVSPRIVEFVDIFPTLAELCRLPPPSGLQGISLVPLLRRPNTVWERPAYSVLGNEKTKRVRARSVRTERWHYVEYGDDDGAKAAMLFDHQTDPKEYKNLAGDPAHAATVAQMKALLKRGMTAPLVVPAPAPVQSVKGKS